jgi:hypothetical protein
MKTYVVKSDVRYDESVSIIPPPIFGLLSVSRIAALEGNPNCRHNTGTDSPGSNVSDTSLGDTVVQKKIDRQMVKY